MLPLSIRKIVAQCQETLTMPLTNRDDIWAFDDMDAAEIAIADAPAPDEILVGVCLGVGGRPLQRIGK